VSSKDARPGTGIGDPQAPVLPAGPEATTPLGEEEKRLLDILVASRSSRTAAQLSTTSGLPKEQVVGALGSLRAKGLVTRFNTLVESYGARFPGVEVDQD
jgi:hypothetical protein